MMCVMICASQNLLGVHMHTHGHTHTDARERAHTHTHARTHTHTHGHIHSYVFSALKMYVTVLTFQIQSPLMWWSGQTYSKAWLCRRCTIVFCHDRRDIWVDQMCPCRDRTWRPWPYGEEEKNSLRSSAVLQNAVHAMSEKEETRASQRKRCQANSVRRPPLSGSDR